MSLNALNDPLIAVRIQREITLKRPPEFSYLSSYAPMSQKRRQRAESDHNHGNDRTTLSNYTRKPIVATMHASLYPRVS